jgi:hypothetical protein
MAKIADNDMEIILKGNQEKVIRKMLDDRCFCLIKMPAEKPERCISRFSSSVFVGHMNEYGLTRSLSIRKVGSRTVYEKCEHYLAIYNKRGCNADSEKYFHNSINRITRKCGTVETPSIEELIAFLKDKELVLITNYMHYGNFEQMKVKDFLEDLLLLWKDSESDFIRRDETCDIRVYLSRLDDSPLSGYGFYPDDIREFDIRKRIVKLFEKYSKKYFNDKQYYSAEYEARTEDVQAAYFVTRFHSNDQWEADPVNVVNARMSAYVLPGTVPRKSVENLKKKKTRKEKTKEEFVIDSIHFNSDIFYDMEEFEKYLDSYFVYFGYD